MISRKRCWSEVIDVCRESRLFESEDCGVLFSGRIDYVKFKLGLFYFEVYCDRLKDEIGMQWRLGGSDAVVLDPVEALFYFSSDVESLVVGEEVVEGCLDALRQTLLVCSRNQWIFGSSDWIDDIGLKRARDAANEWARQQNRPMKLWEFERRIFFEKQKFTSDADLS